MTKKIAIIGGGIAGLSAGCYGRMNGYDTHIFEMHTAPGGVCTGWVRAGYTFDGCLHWLTGSAPGSQLYRMWEELGAINGKKVINHEAFCHIVTPSGKRIVQYADVDRLAKHLMEMAPEDTALISQLRDDVKAMARIGIRMPIDAPTRTGILKKLRMLSKMKPYVAMFRRYQMPEHDYIAQYKSPVLREALPLLLVLPDLPASRILGLLSFLDAKQAGWPEGGSLALAKSIESRYLELGGQIRYGAKVTEIVVQNGRAVGLKLADGSTHEADEVIGAADGRSTIFGMLKGKYVSQRLKTQYDTLPLYTPFMQASFGVTRDMTGEPRLTTYGFSKPLRVGGAEVDWLFLNCYAFDAIMAPAGKSSVTVAFWGSYEYWEKLSKDRAVYCEEKKKVERDIAAWLETVYPGIRRDIEVSDVATPMTTVRYTGNYRASYEGWRPTMATSRLQLEKTLPGLKNFSMIGQWTAGFAGLPTVARDGRVVIELLCKKDGKTFITTKANEVICA